MKEVEALKSAISDFCWKRMGMGLCSDDECEWCVVNSAYALANEMPGDPLDDDYTEEDLPIVEEY